MAGLLRRRRCETALAKACGELLISPTVHTEMGGEARERHGVSPGSRKLRNPRERLRKGSIELPPPPDTVACTHANVVV